MLALLTDALERTGAVRQRFAPLVPQDCKSWPPIPYFGPIHEARVLTLAMSPSADELRGERWPSSMSAPRLLDRLLSYFSNAAHRRDDWFDRAERPFIDQGLRYGRDIAHIDAVCRAVRTIPRSKPGLRREFERLADEESDILFRTLAEAHQARVIVASGSIASVRCLHQHVDRHAARFGWSIAPKPRKVTGTALHTLAMPGRVLALVYTSCSASDPAGLDKYTAQVREHAVAIQTALAG